MQQNTCGAVGGARKRGKQKDKRLPFFSLAGTWRAQLLAGDWRECSFLDYSLNTRQVNCLQVESRKEIKTMKRVMFIQFL